MTKATPVRQIRSKEMPRQYGEGRRCVAEGCNVKLSRYNKGDGCSAHPVHTGFGRVRGQQ